MKVSTIGFYHDFTRLFGALHNKRTPSGCVLKVHNYACVFSGIFREKDVEIKTTFLPIAVRSINTTDPSISESVIDYVGSYLRTFGTSSNRSRHLASLYVGYFLNEFRKTQPDIVIISGDTRMQSRAAKIACEILDIKRLYFEQGPFGTTILDPIGVNCNAGFAKRFTPANQVPSDTSSISSTTVATRERVQLSMLPRLVDYMLQPIYRVLRWNELREEKSTTSHIMKRLKNRPIRPTGVVSTPTPTNYVLVIGQVPSDANFSLHSRYKDVLEFTNDVSLLFGDANFIFREHPLFANSYGNDFYEEIAKDPRWTISRGANLDDQVENADYVVVVNSTVGIEVILKHGRSLLCLGESSYEHLHGVYNRDSIHEYMESSKHIDSRLNSENREWFVNSFIDGHFRDADLRNIISNVVRVIDEAY